MTSLFKTILLTASLIASTLCMAQSQEIPLEKKVAQMIVLGFKGTDTAQNKQIVSDIKDLGIGGVIFFEHNITPVEQGLDSKGRLKQLCTDLQGISPDKLIIAIDQEGGRVNRMKAKYGFPESVTAEYLGQINREDSSRYYYSRMAESIRETGINVNFAPTVDLNINPECPAIGKNKRSYSSSPKKVDKHARYLIEEHHKCGIKTSLKHFPGHGSSRDDSHLGFTDVTETWTKKELKPYKYMIKKSLCDMIMVSHTFNATIDPTYPATLSRLTIDSLLRQKMGYDGIVITDDMNMKAITANYTFNEAIALTINAGVDLIILSNNISGSEEQVGRKVVNTIVKLVKEGVISSQRIDESYNRIVRFKSEL